MDIDYDEQNKIAKRRLLILSTVNCFLICLIFVIKTYQNKKKNPEKSWAIAVLETILAPIRYLKIGPFKYGDPNLQTAMKDAMQRTGLKDFGDLGFVENYRAVYEGPVHKELRITNYGCIAVKMEMQIVATRKLLIVDYLKNHPKVLNVPIKAPVFVFGLGRSGTTFLHRLLSLDPTVHSPRLWELVAPTPKIKSDNFTKEEMEKDRAARLKFMADRLKMREFMGTDGFEHIHEIGADLPEECLFAMADTIPSIMNLLYSCLAGWEVFLKHHQGAEIIKCYENYKQFLQILSYQCFGNAEKPTKFMLKCPLHIFFIKELAQVFPDATLIWAHRHPVPTVASLCTLFKNVHHLYYEKETLNPKKFGERFYNLSKFVLPKAVQDIKEAKVACSHVLYQDLVSKPIEVIKSIYEENHWNFTKEYETILNNYLNECNAKRAKIMKKHNKQSALNVYSPSDFGMTKEQLSEGVFAEYAKQYHITSTN